MDSQLQITQMRLFKGYHRYLDTKLAFLSIASWTCNVQLLNKQTKKNSRFN